MLFFLSRTLIADKDRFFFHSFSCFLWGVHVVGVYGGAGWGVAEVDVSAYMISFMTIPVCLEAKALQTLTVRRTCVFIV